MSSNHPYRWWYSSQFIHVLICEVNTPLHKKPSNGITSILATHTPRMDQHGWKTTSTLSSYASDEVWCTMYHELQPCIQVVAPLSIHPCVNEWGWHTIIQATNQWDHIHTGHIMLQLQGCNMGGWKKTGTHLALAWDGMWCTMSFNHPYRDWHPSQFINGCMGEVGRSLYISDQAMG